ncbi:hypothetical protein KJ766_03025 [Patescibacteria group bacterium]|nr:hypothetical protein [Patescibacteria group bacterium]
MNDDNNEKNRLRAFCTVAKTVSATQVIIGGMVVTSFVPIILIIPILMLRRKRNKQMDMKNNNPTCARAE